MDTSVLKRHVVTSLRTLVLIGMGPETPNYNDTGPYLMRSADPNFTLGGSEPSGFRVVGQRVEERVLVRHELLDSLDVLKSEKSG